MYPLAKEQLDEIYRHAVEEYPFECCGIVIGKVGHCDQDILFQCTNIQNKLHEKDPEIFVRDACTAYHIDPKELINISRKRMREWHCLTGNRSIRKLAIL